MSFFSVTWRIENFSMCPHKNGERFISPKFKLPELANIEWTFSLYPRGRGNSIPNGNYVSFYIRRNDSAQCSEFTWFNVISTVVNLNNSRNIILDDNLKITHNGNRGYLKFISHEDLHNSEFLSNDTLTIHVCICPVLDEKTKLTAPDTKNIFPSNPKNSNYTVEKCFSKDSETDDMPHYYCAFLTRIPIERKRLNWTIKELSAKRTKEKISVTLESEFEGVTLLVACLFEGSKEDDESLKIDISRKGINFRRTMVKCDVSILDSPDVALNIKKSEHVFDETYHRWCFPLIDKLSSSQNLINDDTLKLICDFTISYDPQNVDYLTRSESSHLNNLPAEIQKMLEYEETSDVSFECRNEKKFMTHKFLICAKSPVFRAMFSSDTLESQTGMIRMNDTDTDTVRHLRDFMYLKSFPNLGTEDAIKLYSVAEKYQITKLKDKCSGVLKNNMTVENVCQILTFADLHQDFGLRDFIYDFLIAEMNFDSDLWKTFMLENLSLAAETLRKCVIKGQKDCKN